MSVISPGIFPVDEVENSGSSSCEECEKFDKKLDELRGPEQEEEEEQNNEEAKDQQEKRQPRNFLCPQLLAFFSAKRKRKRLIQQGATTVNVYNTEAECMPNVVIDCCCLQSSQKANRLYYCCCLNWRCSPSVCRRVAFCFLCCLIGASIAAGAFLTVWSVVVVPNWRLRNAGIAIMLGSSAAFIYACCVASHCQSKRKLKELRTLAANGELLQQQRASSANCVQRVGSQASIWSDQDRLEQKPLKQSTVAVAGVKRTAPAGKSAANKRGVSRSSKPSRDSLDRIRLPPPAEQPDA